MTLVVAIACDQGAVLAADGQLTADTVGQPTRRAARKLFAIGERLAWGAAGSVGLTQTVRDRLQRAELAGDDACERRQRLAEVVIPVQQQGLRDYVAHPASEPPDLTCLFVWCDRRGPQILEIPRTGGGHQLHEGFAAIGTGAIFARSAMAALAQLDLRRVHLEQAKMIAYAVIADAIELAALFLGPPIQMYAVRRDGVQEVPREEIDGPLADCVRAWKARQLETLRSSEPPHPGIAMLPIVGGAALEV